MLHDAPIPESIPIDLVTVLALGAGHVPGGPDVETRSAVAVVSGARNRGLALLVATLNAAPSGVVPTASPDSSSPERRWSPALSGAAGLPREAPCDATEYATIGAVSDTPDRHVRISS